MVVYKIRLLQETLKFHILADNFPGEDVDFRAYVISVRIVTGNDFFVSVKDSPAYLFQFVNGDYVMVIAHHAVFGFRNRSVLRDIAIIEVFDRNVVVHQSAVVRDGVRGSGGQIIVESGDGLIRAVGAVLCIQ